VREATTARSLAGIGAAAFLLAGLLGFVPGVTTHYGDLRVAGQGSGAQLLGVFRVSVVLNLVHVVLGATGLAAARTLPTARAFLRGGAVASLALWLLGVFAAGGWVPLDTADNWLHFVLGVGLLSLGSVVGREPLRAAPA
jgi:hypothetical protein